MVSIRPDEISAILKQQIADYDKSVSVSNVGTVLQIGDGIARIHGLAGARYNELLEFHGGAMGLALNLEEDSVGAIIVGDYAVGIADALPVEMRDNGVEDFGRAHSLAYYGIWGAGIIESGHSYILETA